MRVRIPSVTPNNFIGVIMKEILAVIAVGSALGMAGFLTEDKKYTVVSCTAEYSKYWVAEYSESGIDFEGNFYSDYWEEVASDSNTLVTVNGELYLPKNPMFGYYKAKYGYFVPDNPPSKYNYNFNTGTEIDVFRDKTDSSFKAYVVREEDSREIPFSYSKYPNCLEAIDTVVNVKTWYGIPSHFKF